MLRTIFSDQMKTAMKSGDKDRLSTIRLIMAALKDKYIDARGKGNQEGLTNDQIIQMLQSMVKQRRESIKMYQAANRPELAQKEQQEIDVIMSFLPAQMSEGEIQAAIQTIVQEQGATGPQAMGTIMAALKEKYAGRMDFTQASQWVKKALS